MNLHRFYLFLSLLIFQQFSVFSQEIKKNHELSVGIFQPVIYSSLNLNYELNTKSKGIYIGVDYASGNFWYDYVRSAMIDLQFRNYFLSNGDNKPKKTVHFSLIYFSPVIRYRLTLETYYQHYTPYSIITKKYFSIIGGFIFGTKLFFGERCFIDLYAGPSIHYAFGDFFNHYYGFTEYGYKGISPVLNLTYGLVL